MTRRRQPADADEFDWAPVVEWFRRGARDLPWRRTRDPYAVWVSEVMLQQTRVATVIPYYLRFLDAFPDLDSLADADPECVVRAWEGLGYYRRARALHAGARAVRERHAGLFPRDRADALAIPGVGPYTAAAVRSIAYGVPEPCVDGNVRRVVARVFAIDLSVASARFDHAVRAALESPLKAHPAGEFNQALMELGARVCLPRAPRCDECPVAGSCAARAAGQPERWPRPATRPVSTARREVAVAWRIGGSRVVVVRRDPRGRWGGLWEFPRVRIGRDRDPVEAAAAFCRRRYGATPGDLVHRATVPYTVTRFRVRLEVVEARGGVPARMPRSARVVDWDDLADLPMPVAQRRAAVAVAKNAGSR